MRVLFWIEYYFGFILKSSIPPIIIARPTYLFQPNKTFSESIMPNASISAAQSSCAIKIVDIAIVGLSDFTDSITVIVIAIPNAPPRRYRGLTSENAVKLSFFTKRRATRESISAVACT